MFFFIISHLLLLVVSNLSFIMFIN
jgi:hypothetical protein